MEKVFVRLPERLGDGNADDVLSAKQIAEMLDVGERTVAEKWPKEIPSFPKPFYLTGKCKRWYRKDIQSWVKSKASVWD